MYKPAQRAKGTESLRADPFKSRFILFHISAFLKIAKVNRLDAI